MSDSKSVIETLLANQNVSINVATSFYGLPLTPLEMACARCLPETVRVLINHGASVTGVKGMTPPIVFTVIFSNIKSTDVSTPAEARLVADRPEDVTKVLDVLIEAGARVDQRDDSDGNTALLTAVDIEDIDIVKRLVSHGADVNIKNKATENALMLAAQSGNTDIADVLLQAGARLEDTNRDGWTPLFYAVAQNLSEFVQFMIFNGANTLHKTQDGTPLTLGVKVYAEEVARLLIKCESRQSLTSAILAAADMN